MSIDYEQEFELYSYGESLCSQMVRLALYEKQIPFKYHHMKLELTGEHLRPEFKKINPNHLVPVLVHNGEPHYDSWEIIRYLDQYAPEQGTPLWPKDSSARQQLEAQISESALDDKVEIGENFGSSTAGASIYLLANILRRRPALAVMRDYLFRHPNKRRAVLFVVLRLFGGLPGSFYKKFIRRLASGLVAMEQSLQHGKEYFLGDYSAIDAMLAAHFHRLEDIALGELLSSGEFPNIKAYWQRLQQRPSYEKAILSEHEEEWRTAIQEVYGDKSNPYIGMLRREVEKYRAEVEATPGPAQLRGSKYRETDQ